MGLSSPLDNYIDIITLEPVKKWPGVNPMRLSAPWADSLGIIPFKVY